MGDRAKVILLPLQLAESPIHMVPAIFAPWVLALLGLAVPHIGECFLDVAFGNAVSRPISGPPSEKFANRRVLAHHHGTLAVRRSSHVSANAGLHRR